MSIMYVKHVCVFSVVYGSVCLFFHFRPDDDWTIQSKRRRVISELKLVTDNFLSSCVRIVQNILLQLELKRFH